MHIGFNIHGNANPDLTTLFDLYDRWRPSVAVVMNNAPLALTMQERYPDTMIIYRHHPDDRMEDLGDPREWVQQMAWRVPDKRIVLYAGNEIHGAPGITDWTMDAMTEAELAGRRLCVLNCGTGGPEDEEWHALMPPTRPPDNPLPKERVGALWPVLKRLARERKHILGLHEYIDHWDWTADRGWQIGRFHRVAAVCENFGYTMPLFVVTEHGFDSLTSKYKGWRQAVRLGAVTEAQYAAQLIRCDVEEYRPTGCLGQTLFSFGDSGGWHDHDHQNAPQLYALFDAYAADGQGGNTGGDDTDMPVWKQQGIKVSVGVRRRAAPSTSARELPGGGMVLGTYYIDVSDAGPVEADGFIWHNLRDTGGGASWWSASGPVSNPAQYFALVTDAPADPPVEPPDDPPMDPPADPPDSGIDAALFVQQWQTFLDSMDMVLQAITASITAQKATLNTLQGVVNQTRAVLQETREDAADLVDDDDPPVTLVA